MRRTLAGIVGGIALAILVIVVIEALGHRLYPPPAGMELAQPNAPMRMPVQTLVFPLIGWFLGALLGGAAAVWTSRRRWTAWAVAATVAIGALLQFALAKQPVWMIVGGLAAPLVAGLLAQLLAPRSAPESVTE